MLIAAVAVAYGLTLCAASLVYRSSADKRKVRGFAASAGGVLAFLSGLFWVISAVAAQRSLAFNDAFAARSAGWNLAAALAASGAAMLLIVPALFDRWETRKGGRED